MSDRGSIGTITPICARTTNAKARIRAARLRLCRRARARDPADRDSFFVAGTDLVWQPSIPVALVVLAIAQMGVHLVFFLHITTGAGQHQQRLALAFGVLIVVLVIGGSLWIMANLNHNMMPMDQLMQMQR